LPAGFTYVGAAQPLLFVKQQSVIALLVGKRLAAGFTCVCARLNIPFVHERAILPRIIQLNTTKILTPALVKRHQRRPDGLRQVAQNRGDNLNGRTLRWPELRDGRFTDNAQIPVAKFLRRSLKIH